MFSYSIVRYLKLLCLVFLITMLSACATGVAIKSADSIKDDGKSNTVVLSYDITLDASEKYSTVRTTKLNFRCRDSESFNVACFILNIPYTGVATKGNYTAHEFKQSGSVVLKMKYGQYIIDSVNHVVVVGKTPRLNCFRSKKTGKRTCTTRMVDERNTHRAELPEPMTFSVAEGAGCYLGHVELNMNNNAIVDYNFQNNIAMTDEIIATLIEELRESVVSHVTGPC